MPVKYVPDGVEGTAHVQATAPEKADAAKAAFRGLCNHHSRDDLHYAGIGRITQETETCPGDVAWRAKVRYQKAPDSDDDIPLDVEPRQKTCIVDIHAENKQTGERLAADDFQDTNDGDIVYRASVVDFLRHQ